MDRHGYDSACHRPPDPEQKLVRRDFQGKVQCIPDPGNGSGHRAACIFCTDSFLRDVDERICCTVSLRADKSILCQKDASVFVPLGICSHGTASWSAYPGDDRQVETVGGEEEPDLGCLLLCCGFWIVFLPAKQGASLCRDVYRRKTNRKNPLLPVVFMMAAVILGLALNMLFSSGDVQNITNTDWASTQEVAMEETERAPTAAASLWLDENGIER